MCFYPSAEELHVTLCRPPFSGKFDNHGVCATAKKDKKSSRMMQERRRDSIPVAQKSPGALLWV